MSDTQVIPSTPSVETTVPTNADTPKTPPMAPGESKSSPASKERMFKVVVDGKEEMLPESKIIERAQKGMAAEKDMAEAAQYRQAFANFVSQSRDPQKLLDLLTNPKAIGYSEENQVSLMQAMLKSKNPAMVKAIKQWLYENEIEPSTLTEEQRKLRELEKFKTEADEREKTRAQAEKEEEQRKETDRHFKEYRQKIWEGIQANKLPQTELMVSRVARKVQLMRKAGMAADFAKACEFVKMDLVNEYNEHLSKSTDNDILNLLPEGVAERINKAYINRLKGVEQEKIEVKGQPKQKRTKESKDDLNRQLRDIERGRKVW